MGLLLLISLLFKKIQGTEDPFCMHAPAYEIDEHIGAEDDLPSYR